MALSKGSAPVSWFSGNNNPQVQPNITLAFNSKVLVLFILNASTTARTGGSPTFADVAMTQAGSNQDGGTEFNVEVWYLLNPIGDQSSISIPNTGTLTLYYGYISFVSTVGAAYFNVAQGKDTTANPSLTVNNVPAGGACAAVLADGYKYAPTGRSHTAIIETDQGAFSTDSQYGLIASLSNVTMSWTVAADNWAMIMAAFQEGLAALDASASQAAKITEELAASVAAQTALGLRR